MDNTQGKIKFGVSAAPHKLKLIMLIVNRDKVEFYTDFLQDFEVNMQTVTMAHGTASTETLQLLVLRTPERRSSSESYARTARLRHSTPSHTNSEPYAAETE